MFACNFDKTFKSILIVDISMLHCSTQAEYSGWVLPWHCYSILVHLWFFGCTSVPVMSFSSCGVHSPLTVTVHLSITDITALQNNSHRCGIENMHSNCTNWGCTVRCGRWVLDISNDPQKCVRRCFCVWALRCEPKGPAASTGYKLCPVLLCSGPDVY